MRRAATTFIAAAALAATAVLGGCAQGAAAPSVAAEVGDTVITEATLTADIETFSALMAQLGGAAPTPGFILNMEVRGALAAVVEEATGTTIDEAELRPRLTDLGRTLFDYPDTKDLVMGMTKLNLLDEKANAGEIDWELFTTALTETEVNINPRYGEWLTDQYKLSEQSVLLASPLGT